MALFYFYLDGSAYEFERPDIIADPGAKACISINEYKIVVYGGTRRGDILEYCIKQNDTLPTLNAELLNKDDTPINLEMCGVFFHMSNHRGEVKVDRPADIIDVENGKVRVAWQEGDTDKVGVYKCEFEVVFTDNTILTIPNCGYFFIRIVKELA